MKLERKLGKALAKRGLTIAVAESCTGGLITHLITNVPGSSSYFERGFVVYSNRSKEEVLGVKPETLRRYGAVSRQAAREMAAGARNVSGANIALAVTGIAGPISDDSKKPVGLVYLSICRDDGSVRVQKHIYSGSRLQVKKQSARAALELVLKSIT